MEPYSRYLEDEVFIDWVCNPTVESDDFWESYIHDNPEEKDIIYTLREILVNLRTEDFIISDKEKQEILEELLANTDKTIKPIKTYDFVRKYYKYAAILVIILATGLYLNINVNKTGNSPFNSINVVALDSITNTQLTLTTGEQLLIKEEKSTIEYNNLGEVVVNQNDTIYNTIANKKDEVESLNTLIIPYGRRSKIILSDGTIAHLNAGTQFVFPEKFLGDKRTVFLSGEAFFEVTSNKDKPFIVKTIVEELSIEVVGTKFNVSAYPSDNEVLTVLTEGKVNVVEKEVFKNRKTLLKPGQLATWNKKDEKVNVKAVNTDNYTLWIQGLLYFESEPIVSVIKKVERFYNIEIVFDEAINNLISTSISGKLDLKDDINKTLENLMITTGFSFEKIKNKEYMIK